MQKTYTLLDAAALATTCPLDFSNASLAPDFTALSFYKIFGLPDLGALIVRKDAGHLLQRRRYFGGGTVEMVISLNETWHAKKGTLHDACEDGTLPFHSIFALGHALDLHPTLFGSMSHISAHTAYLTRRLYTQLTTLRHANGAPVCLIYNDASATFGDPTTQGATIALNIRRADGSFVGYADVEHAADARRIYVRSGSLCNPGGMATHLQWSAGEMRAAYAHGHRCSDPVQLVGGKPTGMLRVSLGAMSTMEDVRKWVRFVKDTYVEEKQERRDQFSECEDPLEKVAVVKLAATVSSDTSSPVSSAQDWKEKRVASAMVDDVTVMQKGKSRRWRKWFCVV